MDADRGGLPLDGWRLAKSVDGGKLRRYTRADGAGEFGFRFVSEIDVAGAAECMALPRETDLIPEWNIFCEAAEIVRLDSPTELWAQAILKLPWPVPRHLVRLHATLHDRVERDGCFVCHTASPPDFPESLATRGTRRARATSCRCGWASAASCRCPRRSPACRGRRRTS